MTTLWHIDMVAWLPQGELMGELDALEDELAQEAEHHEAGVPSYLQVLPLSLCCRG